jgi:hypothetical protein
MRKRLALVLAPILLLAILPGSVAAGGPGDTAAKAAAREHARVLAYWTPERIRNAQPRDFIRDAAGSFKQVARPSKPGGGGSSVVTGASYPNPSNPATDDVYRLVGRALFNLGGSDYVCSGTVVRDTDSNTSLVLTAGHCVMENDGRTTATNWMFIPQFDSSPTYTCGSTTHGCWSGTRIYGDTEFLASGSFNDAAVAHDWAFVRVGPGGKTGSTQLDSIGSYGLAAPGLSLGSTAGAYGYPAAGRYKGKDLTYCRGPVSEDARVATLTWGLACNMTGGSSGGGWILGDAKDDTKGVLVSVNSYGYGGLAYMFGPKFNVETNTAYTAAKSGASSAAGIVIESLVPRQ